MRKSTLQSGSLRQGDDRRGIVLIAVLLVVVLLSLASYQYADLMTSEYKAADNAIRYAQCRVLAESGVHYGAAVLADILAVYSQLGGNIYNNPDAFRDVLVSPNDSPRDNGKFTILSPPDVDSANAAAPFGATDESGKINVNAVMRSDPKGDTLFKMLMALPNMTSDVANAIVDWLDADDIPRVSADGGMGGAEIEWYQGQSPPYYCKNGPIDSLEELLLVKGVTPTLLFGNDANRNGIQDADEITTNGSFDRGWAAYLTIYSREPNKDVTAAARFDLTNTTDLATFADGLVAIGLPDELTGFILLYLINGPTANPTQADNNTTIVEGDIASAEIDVSKSKAKGKIASVYDLVSATVEISKSAPKGKKTVTVYKSPLSTPDGQRALLPLMLDKTTASKDTELQGRINVNTAPKAVLKAIQAVVPGLNDNLIETIYAGRPQVVGSPDDIMQSPAWLLTEAKIPVATAKNLEKYLTTYTQVYRFQVLGYFDVGGAYVRLEAVVDTNFGMPRILLQRDISELGRGYDLQGQQ